MVACQLPKLNARVRFPLPAPSPPKMPATLGRHRRRGGVLVEGLQGVLEHLRLEVAHDEDDLRAAVGVGPGGEAHRRVDRKSTRLNSSHKCASRMPYSASKKQTHT